MVGSTAPPTPNRSTNSLQSTALKSIKSLAPLLDRVLVQRVKAEAKTKGGLFLPESSVKELNEATVLAVGPGGLDKEGKRVTPSVAPGDKVLIPQVRPSVSATPACYHRGILADREGYSMEAAQSSCKKKSIPCSGTMSKYFGIRTAESPGPSRLTLSGRLLAKINE